MTQDRDETTGTNEGGERGEGRPTGFTESARPGAEGRPAEVREPHDPQRPSADEMPTESPVDRGHTPDTEHEPGGDM